MSDVSSSVDCPATCSVSNTASGNGGKAADNSLSSEQQTDLARCKESSQGKNGKNREQTTINKELNTFESMNIEPKVAEVSSHSPVSSSGKLAEKNDLKQATASKGFDQSCKEVAVTACTVEFKIPDYPLFPLSKGFVSSLRRCVENLRVAFEKQSLLANSSADNTCHNATK